MCPHMTKGTLQMKLRTSEMGSLPWRHNRKGLCKCQMETWESEKET